MQKLGASHQLTPSTIDEILIRSSKQKRLKIQKLIYHCLVEVATPSFKN